jgi:hypothetical protein
MKKKLNKSIRVKKLLRQLIQSALLILFCFSLQGGCGDDNAGDGVSNPGPCDKTTFNCAPGTFDLQNCRCDCPDGYFQYNKECIPHVTTSLQASVTGEGITGSFNYQTDSVDVDINGDTLMVDGYIDKLDAWLFMRVVTGTGAKVTAGQTYSLKLSASKEGNFASYQYLHGGVTEVYSVTDGNIAIHDLNEGNSYIDATFWFDCAASDTSKKRQIKLGRITSAP